MSINKTLVMQILTVLSEQAPKRVSVERLGLCDEQDAELARLAERLRWRWNIREGWCRGG
ncbi:MULTISPECIES: hypothetical protein [unclassified Moraxella]|uniref:hypothetical protein n=1 Tax=unclassified Moraxella TaxID=2685852 RepID=UPI00359EC421